MNLGGARQLCPAAHPPAQGDIWVREAYQGKTATLRGDELLPISPPTESLTVPFAQSDGSPSR